MNALEYLKVLSEDLDEIYYGRVISIDDPKELRRIKVRIQGVYDEPIKKEHIPWAIPVYDEVVPQLGDLVAVFFRQGDLYRPAYFLPNKLEISQRDEKKTLYKIINDNRNSLRKENVTVYLDTFSESIVDSNNSLNNLKRIVLLSENVETETVEGYNLGTPQKGILIEIDRTKDKERIGLVHSSGTFIEIDKNGSIIFHSIKNKEDITEEDNNVFIGGKSLQKIVGDLVIDALSVTINKKASLPNGMGPFCALPNCVFSGAIHISNKADL